MSRPSILTPDRCCRIGTQHRVHKNYAQARKETIRPTEIEFDPELSSIHRASDMARQRQLADMKCPTTKMKIESLLEPASA